MPLIFQSGSNCNTGRLNAPERLAGAAEDRGRAQTIDEFLEDTVDLRRARQCLMEWT